jgi:ATP synthase protein I
MLMSTINLNMPNANDPTGLEDNFVPLTKEQADKLRAQQPSISPWRVVGAQVVVGLVMAAVAQWWFASQSVGLSVAYGALAVVIPAAIFARGMTGKVASVNAGTAVFGFFLWEMVKIALTVAMLAAAPKVIENLSWPGLLAGLIVTIKVYLGAAFLRPKMKLSN